MLENSLKMTLYRLILVPSEAVRQNIKRNVDDMPPYIGGFLDITEANTITELIKSGKINDAADKVMEDYVNHRFGIPLKSIVECYDMLKIFSDHCELSSLLLDGRIVNDIVPYNGSKYIYLIERYDSNDYDITVKTSPDIPQTRPDTIITKIAVNRQNTFNYFACQNIKTDSGEYGDDIYYWDKIDEILKMPPMEMYDFLMTLIKGEIQHYKNGKLISSYWSFGDYIRRSISDFLDPKRFKELVGSGDPLNYEFDE